MAGDAQAELLTRDLLDVFNERDGAKRLAVIREIYAQDAMFYEADASFQGHEAINNRVTELLGSLPPEVQFRAVGVATRNHSVARLAWEMGPAGAPAVATGIDVGWIAENRIAALYVFIDPAGS